ncbi:MAG TPA: antibiotic biosynthesis monooxygenase [Stellaceae bacterium]|nr:antibiotic biosynthesis monooxygenase [Stellaceae bacterium]
MRSMLGIVLAAAPLVAAIAGAALAQDEGAVYVVTYIDVASRAAGDGAALVKRYRDSSRKDGGSLWVAAGQEIGRPNRFILVEAWRDQHAFDGHQGDPEAARFRDAIAAIRHSPSDQRINTGFAVGAGPPPKGAIYVETHIDVPPQRREAAEARSRRGGAAPDGG